MILRGRRATAVPFCLSAAGPRSGVLGSVRLPAAHPAQGPSCASLSGKPASRYAPGRGLSFTPVVALRLCPVPALHRPALSWLRPPGLSAGVLHADAPPASSPDAAVLSPRCTLLAPCPVAGPAPRAAAVAWTDGLRRHGPGPQHEKCIPINSGMDIFCDTVYCHKRTDKLKTTVTGSCGTRCPHGKTLFLPAPADRLPGDGIRQETDGAGCFLGHHGCRCFIRA